MPEILTNIAVVLIRLPTGVGTRITVTELVEIGIEAIHETDDSNHKLLQCSVCVQYDLFVHHAIHPIP